MINGSNPKDRVKTIRKLAEPSFVVTRNAILNNGEYGIDFTIVANDSDRTLVELIKDSNDLFFDIEEIIS